MGYPCMRYQRNLPSILARPSWIPAFACLPQAGRNDGGVDSSFRRAVEGDDGVSP